MNIFTKCKLIVKEETNHVTVPLRLKLYVLFSQNRPLGQFSLVSAISVSVCVVPSPWNLFQGLSLADNGHMITPLIGQRARGPNWVHPHNILCVDALHFDPWCILNWHPGQHWSNDHLPGLSLVKVPGVQIECIHTTVFVWTHSILTPGSL